MAQKAEVSNNPVSRGVNFVGESWDELKKVHPPTREETIRATLVVLAMVALFSAFLGLADYLVGNVMQAVLT